MFTEEILSLKFNFLPSSEEIHLFMYNNSYPKADE
jgi:hypothetical protein